MKHQHCWHTVSSWSNGLGVSGADKQVCCFCGNKQEREWEVRPDPQHGGFVREFTDKVFYKDEDASRP